MQSKLDVVPPDLLDSELRKLHQGKCPQCGGDGPVDVYMTHHIWSLLYLTSWNSKGRLSCRRCGVKKQAFSALGCLLIGWWGIPWGFLMTPVQIFRNVSGMVRPPDPLTPSPALREFVRGALASQIAQAAASPGAAAPPIPDIPKGMATTPASTAPPIPSPGRPASAPSPFSDIGKPLQ